MTQADERLNVMDTIIKYSRRKPILIWRPVAVFLVLLFIAALITTGLLVYHLSPRHFIEYNNVSCRHAPPFAEESQTQSRNISKDETAVSSATTFLATAEATTTQSEGDKSDNSGPRLPTSIIPISYKIYLLPFLYEGNFTFKGNVSVLVNVTAATDHITLHADELDIDEDSVEVLKVNHTSEATEGNVAVDKITNDTTRNFLIIFVNETLHGGELYTINIQFTGILNDLLHGFYRSSYIVNGEKRWIAATQFQPTDARKSFPCFDEPSLKATFQINLGRSRMMSTISNMPINRTSPVEDLDDYVWDHYEDSVPMSTYLVAFVVSDLKKVQNGTFSVWARESALKQASFSLKIGPAILKFYEEFFHIKFPLPKIDMVALPDFSTGAMENWGLITYRESVLLYEPQVSTKTNLQSIAIVVAHELAHQWFGNLVTPAWWSDLWLNEGFASYMEYLGADAVCPELKTLDQFVVIELQNVFHLDSLKSSHQISIAVNNPDEINHIFDRISYGKGATIIRMMEHFLTLDVFRQGLANYLKEREYSSAEQDDLWSALTAQAHADMIFDKNMTVKEIMDTWTLQTGYPIVTATRNETSLVLKQERFLIGGRTEIDTNTLWWIPITYTVQFDQAMSSVWMKAQPELVVDLNRDLNFWLLLNINQTGYYRVNYDVSNWQMLIKQLNDKNGFKRLDPKNRAQLLDDALNLANAGYLDYDIAMNVTRYLVHEREYVPWKAAFNAFDFLYGIFSHSTKFYQFRKYMLYLLEGLYQDVTFEENPNDPTLKTYMRMDMLWRACQFGYTNCTYNSMKQFRNWQYTVDPDKQNTISPNLRGIVYCNAIKLGSQAEWEFAWQRYLNTDVGSEKELLMSALGCSNEPWILIRYLEWAITEGSGIRKQDSVRVFSAVSSTVTGQRISYSFLQENWDEIKKYTGSSIMLFIGIVRECITTYPSQQELNDIKRFVNEKSDDLSTASRVIQQLVEQGEVNLKWKSRNFEKILRWLSSFDS